MKTLTSVRDLLLPGVAAMGSGLAIHIQFTHDQLAIVRGTHVVMTITREEIENGSYKDTFAPRLKEILASKEPAHGQA